MRLVLPFFGFLALALVGCGADGDSTADDATNGDETNEQKQGTQPFQRSEQCTATFEKDPQPCITTGGTVEQPATALPQDFPPMPSAASYCGGSANAQGSGLEWAITGVPNDLQTYFATELAARGYQPTEITHTGVRNCAEAISFSSATHTGFVAFSPGIVSVTISSLPLQ